MHIPEAKQNTEEGDARTANPRVDSRRYTHKSGSVALSEEIIRETPNAWVLIYMDSCTTILDQLRTARRPLTTKQAADLLGLHPQTVYKWARIPGRIPCFRLGGALRFDPAALAKWVEAGSM